MVEGGGFEPPKAVPTDLQSVPFGRSGTPPNKVRILYTPLCHVNSDEGHITQYINSLSNIPAIWPHVARLLP
jgi:hypothetical protein